MNPSDLTIAYDELPLWSAPFGLTLLDTIRMKSGMNVLDIGSGGGFPMFEIAERLGKSCMVYGLDPSEDSIAMITVKKEVKPVDNARIIKGFAEEMPFPDEYFNLIVSNNGINNVADQQRVFSECYRVSDHDSQMVFTVNLQHTMIEFYDIFGATLSEMGLIQEIEKMHQHIHDKRKPVDFLKELVLANGFTIHSISIDGFKFRYTDGTAFFNNYFIRNAFMAPWKSIIPKQMVENVFNLMEEKLNTFARENDGLVFSIPYACFDCRKK